MFEKEFAGGGGVRDDKWNWIPIPAAGQSLEFSKFIFLKCVFDTRGQKIYDARGANASKILILNRIVYQFENALTRACDSRISSSTDTSYIDVLAHGAACPPS